MACVDIGAQTQDISIAMKWGDLLMEEFTAQVRKEIEHGLPPTVYMMGLESEYKRMQLQYGFVSTFVLPLWQVVVSCLPALQHAADQCASNVAFYKERMLALQPPEQSPSSPR